MRKNVPQIDAAPSSLSPRRRQWSRDAPAKPQTYSLKQSCQAIGMGLQNKCTEILRILYAKNWLIMLTTSHALACVPHLGYAAQNHCGVGMEISSFCRSRSWSLVMLSKLSIIPQSSQNSNPVLWHLLCDLPGLTVVLFWSLVLPTWTLCLPVWSWWENERTKKEFIFFPYLSPRTLIQNLINISWMPTQEPNLPSGICCYRRMISKFYTLILHLDSEI